MTQQLAGNDVDGDSLADGILISMIGD